MSELFFSVSYDEKGNKYYQTLLIVSHIHTLKAPESSNISNGICHRQATTLALGQIARSVKMCSRLFGRITFVSNDPSHGCRRRSSPYHADRPGYFGPNASTANLRDFFQLGLTNQASKQPYTNRVVEYVVITGTLESLLDKSTEAEIMSPALIIVGSVVNLRDKLSWFARGEDE